MNTPTKPNHAPAGRQRTTMRLGAVVALVAGIAVFLAFQLAPHSVPLSPHPVADPTCTNCMTLSATHSPPALYPGGSATPIPVTITNVTSVPIHVSSLAIQFTNTFPTNCPVSNFAIADSNAANDGAGVSWSGQTATITFTPQTISGNSGGPNQSWTAPVTLALKDTPTASQDACQNLPLSMTYTGSAYYQVPTTTKLDTSSNSSTDSETLTATVAPDVQPASAALTSPDGGVFFYSCSDATSSASCNTLLNTTAAPVTNGVASITTSASAVGSYNVEAVYSPSTSTNNFVTSTSSITIENLSGCVSAATAGASTILKKGQSLSGTTIASGQSIWLDGGTINGNVTIAAGGSFAATGGTVNGNISSAGGPIAMAGTLVTGNVQSSGGGVALGPGTVVKGNVQASGLGPVCSDGAKAQNGQAANPVQVQGNFTLQSLSSSTTASICSTIVSNNLQWQSNSEAVIIGGSGTGCGLNTVLGNLLAQSNSGSVTIGTGTGNNVVSGNTNVNGNTGGGTITGNKITGNCTLSGDKPGITGTGNTTGKGNNQCNTTSGA